MPYSLLLHCLCYVVLVAYCIMYFYTLPQGEQMLNGDQKSKILTFVALVLKIDKTGLAHSEIVKLVGGVIYSTSMCVLGFVFLCKKWKSLVFIIPLTSLDELAYNTYNLVVTALNWQGVPDEVVPAFFIAVSIACLAVRSFVCWSLISLYKHIRTEFAVWGLRDTPDMPGVNHCIVNIKGARSSKRNHCTFWTKNKQK